MVKMDQMITFIPTPSYFHVKFDVPKAPIIFLYFLIKGVIVLPGNYLSEVL